MDVRTAAAPRGRLAENLLTFARALRGAGLPVGSGAVLDAIEALEAAGIGPRADFYEILHAIFVKKHEHSVLFDQAFDLFWRKRGLLEELLPLAGSADMREASERPRPGAMRVAQALLDLSRRREREESVERDARLTMSAREVFNHKDFAQMSAQEIERAQALIARLRLPDEERRTRRWIADPRGAGLDPRRSFRRTLRTGGHSIELVRRSHRLRRPTIVALCDISGSMSEYTRIFLHFLHVLTDQRKQTHTFLFGTRLTNVTRALRARDVDEALARCSAEVFDWSGGTRIAASLHAFNRQWSRRVLGQGATVILFTDGLEREVDGDLAREMERLQKSCGRLIWVNPLLRFDKFEAKAQGVRAMLPYVDEFRPIHDLASLEGLCAALARSETRPFDWRRWLGAPKAANLG
ncbi:MAG TPA: VWA domain-containing protein [Beijerinckiaceae bacterium]|nr:VWA domain-containing protein [Beijerinckiaceae bacterium]